MSCRHRAPPPEDKKVCAPKTAGDLTTGCSHAAPRSGRRKSAPLALVRTASRNDRPEEIAGCSRRRQRADGRASSPGPRRSAAACWGRSCPRVTGVGVQLLATGHGKAVRTAAVPARADLGGTGCAAPFSGRGPRGRPEERMLLADLGSAGTAGHAERTVAQAVR